MGDDICIVPASDMREIYAEELLRPYRVEHRVYNTHVYINKVTGALVMLTANSPLLAESRNEREYDLLLHTCGEPPVRIRVDNISSAYELCLRHIQGGRTHHENRKPPL